MVTRKTMLCAWLMVACGVASSCDDDQKTENKNPPAFVDASSAEPVAKGEGVEAKNLPATLPWNTVDGSMAAFFKAPASTGEPAAVPPLMELVGDWRATITRVDYEDDISGVAVSVQAIPSFSFSIKREGDKFVMASADGTGSPRIMTATAAGLVAAAHDGRSPLELRYAEGALDGVLALVRPVKGKAEFHAVRNR